MEDVIEVISKGAAQSWQMENRFKTMIDDKFDFGFAVDWMRKDLKIAMDEAKNNGSLLPVTELVDKFYGGIENPIGIKCGPTSKPEEIAKICETLNPKNEKGKITLISRFGHQNVEKFLPKLIRRIKKRRT